MKRFGPPLCLLACALITAGGVQANGSETDQGCAQVHAVGVGQDLGGGRTTATISHGGRLNGTTSGQFTIGGGSFPVVGIAGTVVFTAKHGTLTANVAGTFDVVSGTFNASGSVSGGTGKLAGVTGTLTFAGVENLATGAFTETINGTLCQAGDDADGD
jgi:hypothetical protein